MIYFDIDGVTRDLDVFVNPKKSKKDNQKWETLVNGIPYCDYISQNLNILVDCKPTKYYDVIKEYSEKHIIFFLSHQPETWRPYTRKWLDKYFKMYMWRFVDNSIEEKLSLLSKNDILVDDYPKFSNYDKIVLIDYPYNSHVKSKCRVKTPDELRKILNL